MASLASRGAAKDEIKEGYGSDSPNYWRISNSWGLDLNSVFQLESGKANFALAHVGGNHYTVLHFPQTRY